MNKEQLFAYLIKSQDFTRICQLCVTCENISVVAMPSCGLTSLGSLFSIPDGRFKAELEVNIELDKYRFVFLDFKLDIDHLHRIIEIVLNKPSAKDYLEAIYQAIQARTQIYFVVDNLSKDISPEYIQLLRELSTLNPKGVKFMFLINYYDYLQLAKNDKLQYLWQNVVKMRYLDQDSSLQWLAINAQILRCKDLKLKDFQYIYNEIGPVPGILKNFLRAYADLKSIPKALNSEVFRIYLLSYWKMLSLEEQTDILTIYNGGSVEDSYMKDFGLLDQNNKLIGKWLKYLDIYNMESKFEVKDKRILINDIDISKSFTERQQELIALMLNNVNSLVTREQIAAIIWPQNLGQHFSDYVIDQTMSGLRKKLNSLRLTRINIKTVKGKGFILNS